MDSPNQSNPFLSAHFPITLLALAFCVFFAVQLQEARIENEALTIQKTATTKLHEALAKQSVKNKKELEDRKALVAQSEQIQQQFADESKTVKDRTTSAAQFEALHRQVAEMKKLLEDRKPLVERSENLQKRFTELMKDLDLLARGSNDKDAAAIISAYGIKVNEPAAATTPPAENKEEKKTEEKKAEPEKKQN